MSHRTPPADAPRPDRRRRSLLAAALAGGLLARPVASPAAPMAAATTTLFGDADAARAVGLRYLAVHPIERAAAAVLDRRLAALMATRGPQAVRAAVSRRIRRDFAAGRTAEVDGWILSRFEARLCATLVVG
jgi:hypothetical protein